MGAFRSVGTKLAAALFAALIAAGCGQPQAEEQDSSGSASQELGAAHFGFKYKVGHKVVTVMVPGSMGETRPVDVHLWYPADLWEYSTAPKTEYTSPLHGAPIVPSLWDPLAWKVPGGGAHEGPAIFRWAPKYPVILFSHGNVNVPIDYALSMEVIASAGFVVAAPNHVNNTQDDVRMDFANAQAVAAGFPGPFACLDGRPSPCSHTNVPFSMADRVRDLDLVLDALPAALEYRVDLSRVGMLGHSRGTVTALAAAGGSTTWGITPLPEIKAIMGWAIGAPAITFAANVGNITQPTVLLSGALDVASPPSVSQGAYELLASQEKLHLTIPNAVHRTFDSTYCAQMQRSAALAQASSRALLDRHTASGILIAPISGIGIDYCGFNSFTNPDIRPFVKSLIGYEVTPTNVPRTGLTADAVHPLISEMAIVFFADTIGRGQGKRWNHFESAFPPGFLARHRQLRDRALEYREADERCRALGEC